MSQQDQVYYVGGARVDVGLSAIIKVSSQTYGTAMSMKIFAGGGTLEIVAPPPALTGSSAAGWAAGYPISANEVVNVGGGAFVYLAATGATMTMAIMHSYTFAGASLI